MEVTGLILAGGLASRMGGTDKGLQPFRGEPMTLHAIRRLAPQVDRLAINANRNIDAYEALGQPVWPDAIPGFVGPLAGLHAGLAKCDTSLLACVPCDSPLLPEDLVARLRDALENNRVDASLAVTGNGPSFQRHPVFCLLRSCLRDDLAGFLQQGGRRMGEWLNMVGAVEVHFDDEAAFANINTQADLSQLEGR